VPRRREREVGSQDLEREDRGSRYQERERGGRIRI
jgi:hypothetical protein